MIDIHMHIIPGVDDGSCTLEMSEKMLHMAEAQGIGTIIATSHSEAFLKDTEAVLGSYKKLIKMVETKKLSVKLYLGCEVYCEVGNMEVVLAGLAAGGIPTMNGTKYVLTEFYEVTREDAFHCVERLLAAGWIPVLAHVERYLDVDIESVDRMKEMGCLVQVNVYSVYEESKDIIKERARELLQQELVDFMGSDAHRIGHRPPAVEKGITYLYEHYEKEYVDRILEGNAREMLL
ncbi:MAG: hypothetical protein IJX63_00745 [Lachnospiraceae bacterium]|nr:hypothetical protein [Lachnospiraceae bacterium]